MPSLPVGIALGVTVLIAMELLAGFTISPASIPQPWRIVHYLNPLAYAFRAAALNELRTLRWTSQPAPGLTVNSQSGEVPGSLSEELIAFFQLDAAAPGGGDWVWFGVLVLVGWFVAYVAAAMVAFSWLKPAATKAILANPAAGGGAAGNEGGGLEKGESGAVVLDASGV